MNTGHKNIIPKCIFIALFPKSVGRKDSGKSVISIYSQAGDPIKSIPVSWL